MVAERINMSEQNVSELRNVIGMIGGYYPSGCSTMAFAVKILDVRIAYGRKDYLITPLVGVGHTWAAASSVHIDQILDHNER